MPDGVETEITVNWGDVLELPIPTRENYTFEGWYTGETVNDGKFTTVTPVTKDITLIARWKANITYRIAYETNGGNGIAPSVHYFDDQITSLPTPVKYDYEFAGWYLDEGLTTRVGYPLTLTESITVYAKWEIAYYYINFHTNSGVTMPAIYGKAGTVYESFSVPENSNKTFEGWYYDSGFTQEVTFPLELHSNLDVYAKWNDVYYTVSFNSNGGSLVATQTYLAGYFVHEFPQPTRTNYRFLGWFTDGNLTKAVSYPYEVTGNVNLYAKWEYVDPYADYIRISDVVQLQNITNMNGKYLLTKDIDCGGLELSMIGSDSNPFTGIFIGNGYTVSNFSVYFSDNPYMGLFSVNNGIIRSLKIKNMSYTHSAVAMQNGPRYFGGLAGRNNGTITEVEIEANIQISFSQATFNYTQHIYSGGITGQNTGNINNCAVSGYIGTYMANSSNNTVGGVAGVNDGEITKCLVSAAVSGNNGKSASGHLVGGICGSNYSNIQNCLFIGSISGNYATLNAICGNSGSNAVQTACYKASDIVVSGGTAATESYLNSASFYTSTLGWDSSIWNFSNLNYSQGLYPKLR